jgi:hypothetical protein
MASATLLARVIAFPFQSWKLLTNSQNCSLSTLRPRRSLKGGRCSRSYRVEDFDCDLQIARRGWQSHCTLAECREYPEPYRAFRKLTNGSVPDESESYDYPCVGLSIEELREATATRGLGKSRYVAEGPRQRRERSKTDHCWIVNALAARFWATTYDSRIRTVYDEDESVHPNGTIHAPSFTQHDGANRK